MTHSLPPTQLQLLEELSLAQKQLYSLGVLFRSLDEKEIHGQDLQGVGYALIQLSQSLEALVEAFSENPTQVSSPHKTYAPHFPLRKKLLH